MYRGTKKNESRFLMRIQGRRAYTTPVKRWKQLSTWNPITMKIHLKNKG